MTVAFTLNTNDFPALEGQVVGRELEIEIRAIVTAVELFDQRPAAMRARRNGGSPSEAQIVTLLLLNADIAQTT